MRMNKYPKESIIVKKKHPLRDVGPAILSSGGVNIFYILSKKSSRKFFLEKELL